MGFFDGLCDSPDGEAEVSWHDFWRLDNVCSLTTLGAVVAGLVALLSFLAMLVQYRCCSSGGACRGANGYANKLWNGVGDGGGREETKGSHADDYDGGDFASSAAEPLLAGRDSSAGAGGDDDIANSFFGVMAITDENDNEAGKVGGGGKKTPKKGTGVHWLKLLLYWIQAGYHLSVGAFTLVDGRTDNNPYKCEFPEVDARYHTRLTNVQSLATNLNFPAGERVAVPKRAARRESPPKTHIHRSFDLYALFIVQ